MIWVIIGIVVGAVLGYADYEDAGDAVGGAILGALLVGTIGGIPIGQGITDDNAIDHYRVNQSRQIVALRDNVTTHGQFSGGLFVASGEIHGSLGYFWYERNKDGSLSGHSVTEDDADIRVYEGDYKPHVVTINQEHKSTTSVWWSFLNEDPPTDENVRYDIYVPKGTITRVTKLDLR